MDYLEILLLALGLSFDTFAASLTAGALKSRIRFTEAIRFAIVMALFQGGLPIIGYFAGTSFAGQVQNIDHWIAFILLGILGGRMIWSGMWKREERRPRDLTKLSVLIAVAMGTSIDAFAVGIGFAFLSVRILVPAVIIGIVTFMASMTAIRLG